VKNTPELAEERAFKALLEPHVLIASVCYLSGLHFCAVNLGGTAEAVFRPKRGGRLLIFVCGSGKFLLGRNPVF